MEGCGRLTLPAPTVEDRRRAGGFVRNLAGPLKVACADGGTGIRIALEGRTDEYCKYSRVDASGGVRICV
jgi:hypothetical protein